MADLRPYLEDLEARLDPTVEDELFVQWRAFTAGRFRGDVFLPQRARPAPPGLAWPVVRVNAALEDFELMLLQQLAGCSAALASGSGALLNVRCNYGSSILPSVFGVKLFIMDDVYDTLPTSEPVVGGSEGIRRLVDAGVPDLTQGYGPRVFEMGQRFVAAFADYPKVREYVRIYHPDLQGPMDVGEVLWGSGIFVELVDSPALVHRLLSVITESYSAFMRRWQQIVPPMPGDAESHWSMLHGGHIMLRDDSAMNLSPQMFDEFIAPYNQRLLDAFGGGAEHFCGRGEHFIGRMCGLRNLHAIAMSQPDWNDMETIYRHTVDRGLKLIGLARAAADQALARGRDLHGQVHCW
jgi:hypothetical protein